MNKKVIGKGVGIVLVLASLACSATPLTVREVVTATPLASVTVSASAVKFVAPAAIPTSGTLMSATPWVLTAVGDVNIRADASAESVVLATVRKGESVTVIYLLDGWYRTSQGYIKAEWLK